MRRYVVLARALRARQAPARRAAAAPACAAWASALASPGEAERAAPWSASVRAFAAGAEPGALHPASPPPELPLAALRSPDGAGAENGDAATAVRPAAKTAGEEAEEVAKKTRTRAESRARAGEPMEALEDETAALASSFPEFSVASKSIDSVLSAPASPVASAAAAAAPASSSSLPSSSRSSVPFFSASPLLGVAGNGSSGSSGGPAIVYEDHATPEARVEELERCSLKIHELGGGSQRTARAALIRASGASSARHFPWIWERDLSSIVTVLSELTLGDFSRSMRSLALLQARNDEAEACRGRAEAFAERLDLEPKEVARLVSLVPQVVYQDHSQTLGPSLDLLLGLGFPPRRAASMLMRFPRLVLYRPQRLQESLEALAERGVTREQRMTMLERFPALVSGRPGRSFDAVVGWLRDEIGLTRDEAANVVVRTPFILGCSVQSNLRPSAQALAEGLDLSPRELATILRAVPTALQLRPDTLTRRFSALRRLGADPHDIRRLIVTCPSLLRCQLDMPKYKTKLNFAKHVLGADVPKLLSAFPPILAYSLQRLVLRGAFLKHKGALGGSRGLAVSMWLPKAQEPWLTSLKSSTEEYDAFCEEWVKDPNNARWLDESGDIGDKAVGDDDDDGDGDGDGRRGDDVRGDVSDPQEKMDANKREGEGRPEREDAATDAGEAAHGQAPSSSSSSSFDSPMPPQRPRRVRRSRAKEAEAPAEAESEAHVEGEVRAAEGEAAVEAPPLPAKRATRRGGAKKKQAETAEAADQNGDKTT